MIEIKARRVPVKDLRVGMVGVGTISSYYSAALAKLDTPRLIAACDPRDFRLEGMRRDGVGCYSNHVDLLQNADVDAVVVNAPNDQHFRICRDALLADKHVCCEKPLTTKSEQARELVRLANRRGKTLFTSFHRRYNARFQEALDTIPDPRQIRAVSVRYLERIEDHAGQDRWYLEPQRCGGGCVADNGPNAFDVVSYASGRLEVVSARVRHDDRGVDLEAHVELVTEHGAPVDVHLDWTYSGGERKDITIELADGRSVRADMLDGFSTFKSSLFHEYEAVLTDFAEAVIAGQCRGESGLDAIRLVEDVYAAATASGA